MRSHPSHTPKPRTKASVTLKILLALVAPSAAALAGEPPACWLADGPAMVQERTRFRAGDRRTAAEVAALRSIVDPLLLKPAPSVVQKRAVPPSGDLHDYYSLSPYWWPDPEKPSGPYIRHDGKVNPERQGYDLERLQAMASAVDGCAALYFYTGEERYAAAAADRLRTWFLDPATRMNPNANCAQVRKGHGTDQPGSIIEFTRFRRVPDDCLLLAGSNTWSERDTAAIQAWFGQMAHWMATDPRGAKEREAPNNHGSWDAVQIAEYSLVAGDRATAVAVLQGIPARIAHQIQDDGREPFELVRTKALNYSNFNNEALVTAIRLGQRCGVDPLRDAGAARRLRASVDFLIPYVEGTKRWPYAQIAPIDRDQFSESYWRAAEVLGAPDLRTVVTRLPGQSAPPPLLALLEPAD